MSDETELFHERLYKLYQEDPQRFEEERRRLIRETIEGFRPEQRQKAYGLQFRIDGQLNRYRDPVMRMNKMVEIFWDGVYDFHEALTDPEGYVRRRYNHADAKILPFRRRSEIPQA